MTKDEKLLLLASIQVYCTHVFNDIAKDTYSHFGLVGDTKVLDMIYLRNALKDIDELSREITKESD